MRTSKPHFNSTIVSSAVLALIITVAILVAAAPPVLAADLYWDGTGNNNGWGTASRWSLSNNSTLADPGAAPGASDNAIFNITTVNSAQTVYLNADRAAGTLTFNSTGTVLIRGSSGTTDWTLNLGAGGIIVNSGAGAVTIGNSAAAAYIAMTADQIWNLASGTSLTAVNRISGAYNLTKDGGGTLTLSGANTYTGTTTIQGGVLDLAADSSTAFTGGTISINGASTLQISGANFMFRNQTISFDSVGGGTISLGSGNYWRPGSGYSNTIATSGGAQDFITGGSQGINIGGGSSITFDVARGSDPNSDLTVSSILWNSGSVFKTGNGILTLSGANTYTGATTVNDGTLTLRNSAIIVSSYDVASGATLELNTTAYRTTGAGGISFSGAGTVKKTGSAEVYPWSAGSTISMSSGGLIHIAEGIFRFGAAGLGDWSSNLADLQVDSGASFFGSATPIVVDALNGAGTVTAGGGLTIGADNGGGTFAGVIDDDPGYGSTSLTKSGSGAQVLSGNNLYTGGTSIGAGQLGVGNDNALGTSTVTFNGGTLATSGGAFTIANAITTASGVTARFDTTGGDLTLTGPAARTGSGGEYFKYGPNDLIFQSTLDLAGGYGWDIYQGRVVIDGGTADNADDGIRIRTSAGQTSGLAIINNGYYLMGSGGGSPNLRIADSGTGTGTFEISSGSFIAGNPSVNILVGDSGGGAHGEVFQSGGTVSFVNTSSNRGIKIGNVSGGTGIYNLDGGFLETPRVNGGAGAGTFNFNGGTLRPTVDNNSNFMSGLTAAVVKSGGAIIDTAGFNVTIAQNLLDGGGGLTKNGAGTLTLSGSNAYSGATSINEGFLSLASTSALGSGDVNLGTGSTVGVLQYTGSSGTLSQNITATASGLGGIIHNTTASTILTLDGALSKDGTTLTFQGPGEFAVNGIISGASANSDLVVNGGTTTLNAQNTYTGNTYVYAGGVLNNGTFDALPTNTILNLGSLDNSAGTYRMSGYNQTIAGLQDVGTGANSVVNGSATATTLTVSGNSDYTFAGMLGGTGANEDNFALTKLGTGILTLSGANTYSGGTTVGNGSGGGTGTEPRATIRLAADPVGSVGAITSSPIGTGTLTILAGRLTSDGTTARDILNPVIIGGGDGNGAYFGDTVNSGTLTFKGPTTLTGNRGLWVDSTVVFEGSIGQSGGSWYFDKKGSGLMILTGANTYSATDVTDGTLQVGDGGTSGTLGTGSVDVNSGATLSLNRSDGVTISSDVNLTSGTLIALQGVNDINGGTSNMDINNAGTFSVASGATLNININTGAGDNIGFNAASPTLTLAGDGTGTIYRYIAEGNADGTIQKIGAGTWTLAISYDGTKGWETGGVVIDAGTLKMGAANAIPYGTGKGDVTINGGTLDLNGNDTRLTGLWGVGTVDNVSAGGTPTLTLGDSATTSTFDGLIQNTSGTLAITKVGAGTVTLTGANTYSGGTSINAGQLAVGGDNALGTGTITFNGGTLATSGGAFTIPNAITTASGDTAYFDTTGGNLIITGPVDSSTTAGPEFRKYGPNDLIFQSSLDLRNEYGWDIYDGRVVLDGGVATNEHDGIRLRTAGGGQPGLVITNGGYYVMGSTGGGANLRIADDGTGTATFEISSGSFIVGNPGVNILVGDNNGAHGEVFQSGGTVSFVNTSANRGVILANTGASSSGVYNLDGGILETPRVTGGAGAGTFNFNGGTLRATVDNTNDFLTGVTAVIKSGGGTVDTAGYDVQIDLVLQDGGGGLAKSGAGTLTLTAANLYTGGTTLNAGDLRGDTTTSFGASGSIITLNGGTLHLGSGTADADYTYDLNVAGDANLRALNNRKDFVGTMTGAGTLNVVGSQAIRMEVDMSGFTGTLVKDNTNELHLMIDNGAFGTAATTSGSADAAFVINTGAVYLLNNNQAGTTYMGALSGSGGHIYSKYNRSGDVTLEVGALNLDTTYAGIIDDGNTGPTITALTKVGTGNLTLTAANLYSGGTSINGGTLTVNNTTGSGAGSGAVIVNSSGALAGSGTVSGAVTINSGGHISPGSSVGTLTVGSLDLTAASILDFEFNTGPANDNIFVTTSGGLTLNGGGFNLYNEGTTTTFTGTGSYNLINYGGSIGGIGIGALSVLNPDSGNSYAFGLSGGWVVLNVGANKVWNGGGGTFNWSDTGNWVGGIVPVAGDGLTFGSAGALQTSNNNNLTAGTQFAGITFANDGVFTLNGNTVNLIANVVNNTANNQTINLNLVLDGGSRFFNAASGDLTMNGVISGASASDGLVKTGANTLTLTAGNTYTGDTIINDGVLDVSGTGAQIYKNAATVNAVVTVNSGGVLVVKNFGQSNNTSTSLGNLANTTASASVVLDGGTLRVSGDTGAARGRAIVIGANGGTIEVASGAFTMGNTGATLVNTYAANSTLTLAGAADGQMDKLITGSGVTLIKTGAGTWDLRNSNTYTGNTTINGGTLDLRNGQIYSGGSTYSTQVVTVENGATLRVQNFGKSTGSATSLGNLDLDAARTIVDGATIQFNTTVTNGRGITVGANGAVLSVASGVTWTQSSANANVYTAGATLTLGGAGTGQMDNTIDGTGVTVVKDGSGTWTLTGANTYTGGTTLLDGTLEVTDNSALGSGTVTFAGAAELQAGANNLTLANTPVTLGAAATVDTLANQFTITGAVGGSGSLAKLGTGILSLPNANTYTGGTTLGNSTANTATGVTGTSGSAGSVEVGHNDALGTGTITMAGAQIRAATAGITIPNDVVITGGGFRFGGANDLTFSGPVVLDATRTIGTYGDASLILDGVLSGPFGINKDGTGKLVLNGDNTFSGGADIGNGAANTSSTGIATSGSDGFVVIGHVNALGTGIITMEGAQIWAGVPGLVITNDMNITSGAFRFGGANDLTFTGTATLSGGNREIGNYSGTQTLTLADIVKGGNDLTFMANNAAANNGTIVVTGNITGGGALTVNGSYDNGTIVLKGANSYGTTTVNAGTLRIGDGGTSGTLGTGAITIANGGELFLDRSDGFAVDKRVTFSGGTGTLTVHDGANSFLDTASTTAIQLNGGATAVIAVDAGAAADITENIGFGGNPTLVLDGAGTGTISGSIASGGAAGSAVKNGSGTWVLTVNNGWSTNSVTGPNNLTVNDGILRLNATEVIPDDNGVVVNGGTLELAATYGATETINILTLAGGTVADSVGGRVLSATAYDMQSGNAFVSLTGSGATLTKSTSGTVVLTGDNSYTGATTISGGVLELDGSADINSTASVTIDGGTFRHNSSTAFTGTLTFGANGGTISGTGVIDTSASNPGTYLSVGTDAVLSPGNSPAGQNYLGTMNWADGGKYVWEINDWHGVASNNWDFIDLDGALNFIGLTTNFTIEVVGLTLANTPGVPPHFSRADSRSFPILNSGFLGIDGSFDSGSFTISAAGFPSASYISWTLTSDGNTLWLNYTAMIPEPTTVMLLGLGGLLLFIGRRLRKHAR